MCVRVCECERARALVHAPPRYESPVLARVVESRASLAVLPDRAFVLIVFQNETQGTQSGAIQ